MAGNNKIVKFKKRRTLNIGIIVFLVIFIYIVINIYIYITKDHISIYEVHEGTTAKDNRIKGLVIREEEVILSKKAGYITYFQKEGGRVSRNSSVYAVDESREIVDVILSGDVPIKLTQKDNAQISHEILSFQKTFSDSNFSSVYSFKEDASSLVLDLLNTTMLNYGQTIQDETGLNYSYDMYNSDNAGVISYYVDSYEALSRSQISSSTFNKENYVKTNIRATSMLPINSPIYKIVTSDKWNIILPLTSEQSMSLRNIDQAKITFLKDKLDTKAKIELYQNGSEFYAELTLDKYMTNYINDRFLDIELHINSVEGLKIPKSSILEKDFFLVPLEYFTEGGDSNKEGLIKEVFSEKGDITYQFVPTDMYYQDEVYGYVDSDIFEIGQGIVSSNNLNRLSLSQMSKLTGVYCINTGYSVFKRIEILYEDTEYYIIDKNTAYGLSAYDHIALDGSTAINQAIIY
ncbi:MAG: hypothetical protein GX915_06535 [Clostridiales bacterium]|nr:hypothetical protein [Clostridiales bacterium]